MPEVYLSIGSNVDRERNIRSSVRALYHHFGAIRLSPVYESAAIGFAGEPFYNLAAAFESDLPVAAIDAILTRIEDEHGRDRSGPRFAPRTIDLDLLIYGDQVSDEPGLKLPRPEILQYAFVLRPLSELAGDFPHPALNRTFAQLWNDFDQSRQPLWPIAFDWNAT